MRTTSTCRASFSAVLSGARLLVLAGFLLGLGACGGGGSSDGSSAGNPADAPGIPGTPVSLANKADVQREMANALALIAVFDPGLPSISPSDNPSGQASAFKTAKRTKADVVACDDSGSDQLSDISSNYNYSYFGITNNATSATHHVYSNCLTGADIFEAQLSNGVVEIGASDDQSLDWYEYLVAGTASNAAAAYVVKNTSGDGAEDQVVQTISLLGTIQRAHRSNGSSSQIVRGLNFSFSQQTSAGGGRFQAVLGSGSRNFVTTNSGSSSVPQLTIDGPLSYTSLGSSCHGGTMTLATPVALQFAGDTPDAGQLKISAGATSATVIFNADGSATITYSNGSSDVLTADEVSASVADNGC